MKNGIHFFVSCGRKPFPGLAGVQTVFFRFSFKTIVFLAILPLLGLSFSATALGVKQVTGVSYGSQSGSATYGTGCNCISYTITLTETGTTTPAADNILLTWTSGTPTGVTWSFTSSTESVTGGATTTPAFTPSGTTGSTITFTITTSASTPAGSYGFTIKITDNNLGGGPYTSSGLTLVVSPKTLTISGLTANNKTYDRTTAATLSGTATLNGVVGSDVVSLSGSPTSTFASANVGTGIAVTVTGYTLTGAGAGNYTVSQPAGLTGNITAKALTISSAAASNKVYDNTTTATVTGTLTGMIGSDIVTLSASGTFDSANVGTGIAVTSTSTISGANAGNYTLTQPMGLTANITQKTVTITGITASNKTYDGTTTCTLSGSATLSGVYASDGVLLNGTGTAVFASANVGTGISVTVSGYSLIGGNYTNYNFVQPTGLTANITAATLVIAAIGPTKVTGNTSPAVTGSTTNFIYYGTVNGETVTSVTLTPSPTTSQTAGSTYTVTPSAAAGANGFSTSNYSITYTAYSGVCSGHNYTWTGNTSTTWSTSTNWSPNGTPGSTDDVTIPSGTTNAPTVTSSTTVNTVTITGNNTITLNSGVKLITNSGFTINSAATAANFSFAGSSTATTLEINSAIFANFGSFNLSGKGLFQIDNNGSYIYNSGTFTAGNNTTLYLQGGTNVTHALTNAGTFYAGSSGSTCYIEVDDYGSIDNSGTFYMGPTTLMYYYNELAQYVVINNHSGGTFVLQSDATGSASIGEVPQGRNNQFTGTFSVQRYFQGGNTYSGGRWVERSYRIISSPVNIGATVNGNSVYGLNYIVGSTAGQTTTANSSTNAFVTGCAGCSTALGNPSIYLYNESYTPNNTSYVNGNFLGITNITSSTTGGTITASDGGSYSMPVGTGVLFFFRGAATNWSTRTVSPYIAPENVTLTSTGNMNVGSYTFKDWYAPASSNLAYTGSGSGTNSAVRGFNMIGNPYACPIDWLQFYSGSNGNVRTNVSPTIWVFNPVTYQYDTYLATSSSTGTATGNASRYIASGQGFFVQATAANPSLTISEYAKVVWSAGSTVETRSVPAAAQLTGSSLLMSKLPVYEPVSQSLRLKLSADSLNHDDIFIGFNSLASEKYNFNEDGRYLPGLGAVEGLSSISSDNVKLAINYVPLPKQAPQVIKLYVTARTSGEYKLKQTAMEAIPQIFDVWLIDNYRKDSLDLRKRTIYAFKINLSDTASYGSNRFSVVIRQNPALAVQLLTFTGNKAIGGAQVTWTTKNEENYTHFTVERSIDGGNTFNVIGGIPSTGAGKYSFLDKAPAFNANRYRLKLEDLNGTITYSKVVTLMYSGTNTLDNSPITLYPNPAKTAINLTINQVLASDPNAGSLTNGSFGTNAKTTTYSVKIINSTGLVVKTESTTSKEWQADIKNLLPGTYVMQVYNSNNNSLVGKGSFVKL